MTASTTAYMQECSGCGTAPVPLRHLVGWRGWTFLRCNCDAASTAVTAVTGGS